MNNRIGNSIRNTVFGFVLKIITMIGAFAARSMLIYCLGVEYVGLDGLFSSILTMLNMAELGFGSAVVFKLYKPLADNDTDRVCALLNFYRKVYTIIGWVVFSVGIVFVPFLRYLIKGNVPEELNLTILYVIYLLNTCCSYWFFAYKGVLLNALNRNDIVSKVSSVTYLTKYIIQFLLLLLFRNYYVYAIIIPVMTLTLNVGNALVTNKLFPHYSCKGVIDDCDKREIKTKVSALIYNKIGVTIINASDNIVISSFLGLVVLGIYDSYFYIFTMLYYFFSVFHSAITAGVGNSIITESVEQNYILYKRLTFINSWLVGFCSICLLCLYEPFMSLWIGVDKVLGVEFALLMSVYFYFWLIRFITIVFKNAQGLWVEDKFRACIEGVVNLVLNIFMVRVIGIFGITLSTIVAMILVSIPWETYVLFHKYFRKNVIEYCLFFIKWLIVTAFSGLLTFLLCSVIQFSGVLLIVLRLIICMIIPNVIYCLVNLKSDEFMYVIQLSKRVYRKVSSKKMKERG